MTQALRWTKRQTGRKKKTAVTLHLLKQGGHLRSKNNLILSSPYLWVLSLKHPYTWWKAFLIVSKSLIQSSNTPGEAAVAWGYNIRDGLWRPTATCQSELFGSWQSLSCELSKLYFHQATLFQKDILMYFWDVFENQNVQIWCVSSIFSIRNLIWNGNRSIIYDWLLINVLHPFGCI